MVIEMDMVHMMKKRVEWDHICTVLTFKINSPITTCTHNFGDKEARLIHKAERPSNC